MGPATKKRTATKKIPELRDYDVHPVTGFLPSEPLPLQRLPGTFYEAWELVLDDLQRLLLAGRLRERVRQLPLLDVSHLKTLREWQRAYLVLSFLGQGYIWGKNEAAEEKVPKCIAIPWLQVCDKLDVKPIISYAGVELYNFKLLDPTAPWDLSNLSILHTFSGGMDEAWFFLVSIAIEPLALLLFLQLSRHCTQLKEALTSIAEVTEKLKGILVRMYEKTDAHVFFNRVRPYMNGWENSEDLPNGVLYEGVLASKNGVPNGIKTDLGVYGKYAGGSAGQSTLIHVLDAALDIVHAPMRGSDPTKVINFIHEMRNYMPGPHRKFVYAISDSYSIRDFVENLAPSARTTELVSLFNKCVEGMKAFRNIHIQMVSVYIVSQANKRKDVGNAGIPAEVQTERLQNGLMARGTGGTNLIPFLKQSRDETSAAQIQQ
ncbi:Indoleamine 2,3-dioxygenase [Rhizoclosmatium globosum]|uniref:Indoleamine 2,3-dioxygenase n=1 Tax=Rhizoclosmatium globosum TaxID=329046 RepID=A0A1Y2BWF8_9FUNG|nr:Indoleamine 2,3-dioxygenase [Rhizoclosmatium globosum]|eukprot:ORY39073.1 Indoleamine 2,3-dioxygenase [Rhizoclosmatium globosum]